MTPSTPTNGSLQKHRHGFSGYRNRFFIILLFLCCQTMGDEPKPLGSPPLAEVNADTNESAGASDQFNEWAALASAQTRSSAMAETGDLTKEWIAPDGRKINVVVKAPQAATRITVTLPPVPDGEDARPFFDAALARVKSERASKLIIPKATYTFKSIDRQGRGHWVLEDLNDLSIEGNGSTFVFTQNKPGVYLVTSKRVKLSNVTIEFSLHMASLATMEKQAGQNVLVIDSKYPVSADDTVQYLSEFDAATKSWVQGGQRVILPPGSATPAVFVGNQTYASAAFKSAQLGKTFVVFHQWYGGAAILMEDSPGPNQTEDITLDHICIYSAPGMGIIAYGLKRGLAILNSKIMVKPDALSLISTEYDAIHPLIVGGDVIISNNQISGQGDDGINLDNPVHPINTVSDDGKSFSLSTYSRFIRKSDSLAFFDADGSYLGKAMVDSEPKALGGLNNQISVDRAVPGVSARSLVRDIQLINSRIAVTSNKIERCNCHGILVQVPNTLVEDNVVDGPNYNGIRLLTNFGGFKEGVGAFNVIVKNNIVSNTGMDSSLPLPWGAISVYGATRGGQISSIPVNKNIQIIGNVVNQAKQGCITVASSRNVIVTDNRCNSTNQIPKGANGFALNVLKASEITFARNKRSGESTGGLNVDLSTFGTGDLQSDF